jgi:ATP-binding cassette, subfamily B, multidrug efflux pump
MHELKYLNKYLLRYKWRFLLGILFIILSNLFKVHTAQVINDAISSMQSTASLIQEAALTETLMDEITSDALTFAGLFILVSIISGFFLFLTRQTIIVMSRFIEFDLKNDIYKHYQDLSLSFYKLNKTGDLMNRISEDVSKVRMYLGPALMYTINLAFLFVFVLYNMFAINIELSLYVLAPLPVMSVLIYKISRLINRKSERVQRQQSVISSFVQEAFSGIRVLKAYNRNASFQDSFDKESSLYREKSLDLVKINALFHPVIILLIGLSTILTIYLGGLKAYAGEINVGDIAAFVIYVNMLTWPFASVGWVTSLVQRAAASQERINEFLNTVPEINNPTDGIPVSRGEIEFKSVSFRYPDTGILALDKVSFKIPAGAKVAFTGKTGSGKSTIAALIGRQFDVTDGEILIDGVNIKEIDLNSLRQSIGYVPQDVFLFSDTISNNIAFGVSDEDNLSERIKQAAKNAMVYDNIMDFNDGFETLVGERGITLSGGQKQRVSIARAIIREPKILIFDDCLSAVDTETEDKILGNLKKLMYAKTAVLISHRISTVRDASIIYVLDQGKVIEQGTHQELIKNELLYRELFEQQLVKVENI